jgi:transposase-like protein
MTGDKRSTMCEACASQVHARKYDGPHEHLVLKNSRRVSSIMGAADEAYYTCSKCGHDWLHETGSAGMGWVP